MVDIKRAINIIEFWLAPAHIIMIGPKDTFGRLFNIVRYGSNTLEKKGLYQRNAANIIPINEPKPKLINISFKVTHTCTNKSLDLYKLIIVVTTFLGLEHKNEFIIPLSDRICHRLMNSISINI